MFGILPAAARRRLATAAAAAGCAAAAAGTLCQPAHLAGRAAPAPGAPDPRNTHFEPYMKAALSGVLKHGMPSKDNVKYRDGHCLSFDRMTRNPRWRVQKAPPTTT